MKLVPNQPIDGAFHTSPLEARSHHRWDQSLASHLQADNENQGPGDSTHVKQVTDLRQRKTFTTTQGAKPKSGIQAERRAEQPRDRNRSHGGRRSMARGTTTNRAAGRALRLLLRTAMNLMVGPCAWWDVPMSSSCRQVKKKRTVVLKLASHSLGAFLYFDASYLIPQNRWSYFYLLFLNRKKKPLEYCRFQIVSYLPRNAVTILVKPRMNSS